MENSMKEYFWILLYTWFWNIFLGLKETRFGGEINCWSRVLTAAAAAVNQALWIRKILSDLQLAQMDSTKLFVYDQAAITISTLKS